ncbi:hypothetical protein [Geomonas propionica]|uniref:MFS transporter n=1 Tax=Geomonas propionica TaxID=2798582 RepID=A0ABS0YUH8_9BACT|nr:hypothetical protein [Geomonas propionica]MBJ6801630.1 hypothetical protein [Geomonas propionica]
MAPEEGAAVKPKTIGHGENLRTSEKTVSLKRLTRLWFNPKAFVFGFLRFTQIFSVANGLQPFGFLELT